MTDESIQPVETPTEEAPAPTLEDISKEFSVEEQVNSFQAQPEPQAQPQGNQGFIPDPISNPEDYTRYSQQQAQSIDRMNSTLEQLAGKVNEYESKIVQQQVEADVTRAVAKVNEKLGVDEKLAEIALRMEYEKNPDFQKIWDNRGRNPKAFDKALDVVANEYSNVFAVKQDPQLTENQLAAKKSLQTMNKSPVRKDESWDNLTDAEFEQKWNQMRGR